MQDAEEFSNEEITYSSVTVTLYREDVLDLIRALATHGEKDTTMRIATRNDTGLPVAHITFDGSMGPVLSVEETLVRIPTKVSL
jgi:hypothetical protein